MSLSHAQGKHVHYPATPDKFEFDAEVATIFDSMAIRSIPMYAEVHRMHVEMFADKFVKGAVVADIGASTGNFFTQIELQIGKSLKDAGIRGFALDSSVHMLNELHERHPSVELLVGDLSEAHDLPQPADVIACLYVLQFMRGTTREKGLQWLRRNLAPGGILILGQKEREPWRYANRFSETYYAMRRRNGYTQAEIDAKTAALKNSMWPVSPEEMTYELNQVGLTYTETTRWAQFTSGVSMIRD